jgi:uncharacterized membrane-anchored protein
VFLGRRTKDLVPRLAVGSIAVLDHADLDGVAARSLALRRPCAIVNNQPTITGRYANRGPLVLIEAGIPVFDLGSQAPGNDGSGAPVDLFAQLRDGERVTIEDGARLLRADGSLVTAVRPLSRERLEACWEAARANLDAELSAFAENTLRFLQRPEERALLLGPVAVPPVRTRIGGRPVLVVVRGDRFEDDLQQLGRYVREQRPVVIAVDGAADTLLALGVRPNIILGDMDSVTDGSLRCGAELVVHAYAAPRADAGETAPGLVRLRALGLAEHAHTFPVPGTSEDAALLLAFEKGADLIVAVGTHTNLEISRQGPAGDGEHVPGPPQGGQPPGRRARRFAAVPDRRAAGPAPRFSAPRRAVPRGRASGEYHAGPGRLALDRALVSCPVPLILR